MKKASSGRRSGAGKGSRFRHLASADLSSFREHMRKEEDQAFARSVMRSAAKAGGQTEPTRDRSPGRGGEGRSQRLKIPAAIRDLPARDRREALDFAERVLASAAKARGEPGSRGRNR